MSRSYPIWNKVRACIYQSDKSWGAKNDSNLEILVGTSSKNSHLFVEIRTLRVETDEHIIFKFYVDNVKVKECVFDNVKGKASGNPRMKIFNNFVLETGDLS
jgi:hypothetical protein